MSVRTEQWVTIEPIFDGEVLVTADITGRDRSGFYNPSDPSGGIPEHREVELTVEYNFPPYEDITDGPRRLHGEEVKQWDNWLDELRDHACELEDEADARQADRD